MLPQLFGPWMVPKVCFRAALTRFSEAVSAWEKIFCVSNVSESSRFFHCLGSLGPVCGVIAELKASASSRHESRHSCADCFWRSAHGRRNGRTVELEPTPKNRHGPNAQSAEPATLPRIRHGRRG